MKVQKFHTPAEFKLVHSDFKQFGCALHGNLVNISEVKEQLYSTLRGVLITLIVTKVTGHFLTIGCCLLLKLFVDVGCWWSVKSGS